MTKNTQSSSKLSRRTLLQAAAGSAALAAVPAFAATRTRSAAAAAPAARASLGFWHDGALANPAHVRGGWLAACASSRKHGCDAPLGDEIVDAARVSGNPGQFRVRTVALANGSTAKPARLVAEHGPEARHELWSVWSGGCSSPVATRMVSNDGSALALSLVDADGTVQSVALPAKAGTYVLALGHTPIRWRGMSLVARDVARPLARELVQRASGASVASPYLLLTVERLA